MTVLSLLALLACTGDAPSTPSAGPTASAPSAAGPATTEGKTPVTTSSGLSYVILADGSGETAAAGDIVGMQYTGWLTDGTKFDSSLDHGGQPFTFNLGKGQVIPGWDEGVAGMKVGEKRQLRIPSTLGYGATGTPGGPIPPNADLVFDVELVKVTRIPTAPASTEGKAPVKSATGLTWVVLAEGSGAVAAAGDTVQMQYAGWLTDGTMFDTSYKRGKAFTFPLGAGRVIKGWDEGVAGMKVGEKRQLRIPPELGYGEKGTPGGPIPPNAELVFDVELVGIKGK
jgi:peptidylprolyl isomerase